MTAQHGCFLGRNGELFTSLGVDKEGPERLFIERDGYVRHLFAGAPGQEATDRLFREIGVLE